MADTKRLKVEFGSRAYRGMIKESCQNTRESDEQEVQAIRLLHIANAKSSISGQRKINFANQRKQETYRKINKMLGGS